MPKFVIERQYPVPMYQHIVIEAENLERACKKGISDDIDWDTQENGQRRCSENDHHRRQASSRRVQREPGEEFDHRQWRLERPSTGHA
jgi:hypothetical protein